MNTNHAFKKDTSRRIEGFTESVIREMTRLCIANNSINLAQGFPDFDPPEALKQAAITAINNGYNQYSNPYGSVKLRQAIAKKARQFNHFECDPETEVTLTCGTSEAMMATLLALLDPGDEVIILEPFYENYGPDTIMSGAKCRYVTLEPPTFQVQEESLKAAFNRKTKAIVTNTPHNPTGKVFTRAELKLVAELCQDYDALAITDEIYEHIIYDGKTHTSIASLDNMGERTVTISGFSKTYSATGWRVGYAIAPKKVSAVIRKVHDFLTVCAPSPLQEACITALRLPESYYTSLRAMYDESRQLLLTALEKVGIEPYRPEGSYYVWTNISDTGFKNDRELAEHLVKRVGVGSVPGSSFFHRPSDGKLNLRFAFSKKPATIKKAVQRLAKFRRH